MTYPSVSPAPASRRGPLVYLVTGCVIVALCLSCLGIGGAGYYFYSLSARMAAGSPAVEYILDASPRMALPSDTESGTRLSVAQAVLAEIIRPADPAVTAGLRVFGSGAQSDGCKDTSLLVGLATANKTQISTSLQALNTGTNPAAAMAEAMVSAIRDLAPTSGPHTLVVITGGADTCSTQAGQLIADEAKKAGIDLQLFVVGYQVSKDDGDSIKGLVDGVGSGTYVNASNRGQLTTVLTSIQKNIEQPRAVTVASVRSTAVAAGATTVAVQPTPAATGGNGTGGTGQTACDHPYFPLRSGATWNFTTASVTQTWTVTDVTGDSNDATATMNFTMPNLSFVVHWHCTPDGIDSSDFGTFGLTSAPGASNLQVTKNSGHWLIAADKLTVGATWDNAYTYKADLGSGGTSALFTYNVDEHYTVAGTEAQTVGSETHPALRVESAGVSTIASDAAPLTTTLNLTGTIWLARGIGPVRIDNTVEGASSSSVLTSYSIP